MEATQYKPDDPDTLDALLSFSWYQCWTRPRADIIEHTIILVHAARDKRRGERRDERRVAESVYCRGYIYYKLDRFEDTCVELEKARDYFLAPSLDEPLVAARCSLKLSEIYLFQKRFEDARKAVREGQERLKDSGDERAIADGLLHLGEYYWHTKSYADARKTLREARNSFLNLAYPLDAAHCLLWISKTFHNERNYNPALKAANDALCEYQRLAYKGAACYIVLSAILVDMCLYTEALKIITQGLDISKELGSPSAITQLTRQQARVREVNMESQKQ